MPKPKRRPYEILRWFEEHPDSVTTLKALSVSLDIPYDTVVVVVRKLVEEGKVKKVGRGLYAHPSFKSEKL